MTQLKQEEIRDEMLSLFEEYEEELLSQAAQIEKIENEGIMFFEMKEIAIKNRIAGDVAIPEEEVEERYMQELELLRKAVLEETERKLKELIEKQKTTTTVSL